MCDSLTIETNTGTSNAPRTINTGYLKTYSGILKVLELLLGIVCIGIISQSFDRGRYYKVSDQFFILVVTTLMIATFALIVSCLVSLSMESIVSRAIYEVIYHAVAFGLLLVASLTLIIKVESDNENNEPDRKYEILVGWVGLGASICGLGNSGLYFFSTMLALRTYRSINR